MNDYLVQQAARLFDDMESWSTYLDLSAVREKILTTWYDKLIEKVSDRLKPDKSIWTLRKWNSKSWGWYTGADENSLVILYQNNGYYLWIHQGTYNISAVVDRFKTEKIFAGFFSPAEIHKGSEYMAKRDKAISVNGITDPDLLAWYAGHESEETELFVHELCRFFSYFIHDAEIIATIHEINLLKR